MSDDDLHIHDTPTGDPVPYECTACHGIGWTRRSRPQCEGFRNGQRHALAAIARVDGRDVTQRDDLVLR